MKPTRAWMAVAAVTLIAPATAIAECKARSPDHTLALVELYTSEGCDSCPPADRWLSRFEDRRDIGRVVALALHVDYWDRLGWKDRFASAAFTQRQREEGGRQRSPFIYTPQVMLDGRDFPQWHSGEPAAAIAAINARAPRARLEIDARSEARSVQGTVRVQVPNTRDRKRAILVVALVQSGLASDVNAGENAGKRLAHDHVVRQWRAVPASFDAGGDARERYAFEAPVDAGPLSIVAFAEDSVTGDVLQALALPLCDKD